ncbi:MAG: ATP-binding cassette domain-containing protein [Schleiferiaceae bacterium]|jgi:ABC-type lipoprotein export system ATPase subunit
MRVTVGTKEIHYPSLEFTEGIILFTGPSGSGKTTLLRALHGELAVKDSFENWPRNKTAMMPQQNTWIPYLNLGIQLRQFGGPTAELIARQLQLERQLEKHPNELSVGQLQRFSLALTLSSDSSVFLLDEPTSALDDDLADLVFALIDEKLKESDQITIVAVTHDPRMKKYFSTAKTWQL